MSDAASERDEMRIRVNLRRYLDARGAHNYHEHRARIHAEEMKKAMRDLIAAGGTKEAARYGQ